MANLKVNFVAVKRLGSGNKMNAILEVTNAELCGGQTGERSNYALDCGAFGLGADDAENSMYLTLAAARAAIYAANKAALLASVNETMVSVVASPYSDTELVGATGKTPIDAVTDAFATKGSPAIAVAASATTNGIEWTVTMRDSDGNIITGVHDFECYIAEDAAGATGLTADTASGALTAVTGVILAAITAKKHVIATSATSGILTLKLVDTAEPTDQYLCVKGPSCKVTVSAASGTNWG